MNILMIGSGIVLFILLILIFSVFKVSSEISREEERIENQVFSLFEKTQESTERIDLASMTIGRTGEWITKN